MIFFFNWIQQCCTWPFNSGSCIWHSIICTSAIPTFSVPGLLCVTIRMTRGELSQGIINCSNRLTTKAFEWPQDSMTRLIKLGVQNQLLCQTFIHRMCPENGSIPVCSVSPKHNHLSCWSTAQIKQPNQGLGLTSGCHVKSREKCMKERQSGSVLVGKTKLEDVQ